MKILVLGLNYAPEQVGIGPYTTGMAEALAAMGHDVQVVAGQPYYPEWRIAAGHNPFAYSSAHENGVGVLRVPHYIPRRPNGVRRLLHHLSFAFASLFPALWSALTWRPQLVIVVAPSLLSAPVGRLAAQLCGAQTWLHLQDFEVEAAFATGLLAEHGHLAVAARWFERRVLSGFGTVSSISPNMCRRLVEKGVEPDKIVEFRNWADLEAIRPLAAPSPFASEWAIKTPHVALYAGNIANKQGIEIVVEAARLLADRRDLTFVVCGNGPNRPRLEELAADLANVQFRDLQPKERLGDLLGLATVHLLPQEASVADLVLPSKLTNMLASGRPIVATAMEDSLADEVRHCGVVVLPAKAQDFALAIARLLDDDALQARLGNNARRRAEERWSRQGMLQTLASTLEQIALQ